MSHLHTCHHHNVNPILREPVSIIDSELDYLLLVHSLSLKRIGPGLELDNVELSIPVPGVAIIAVTDGLHGLVIKVASLGVAVATGPGARTQTLSAGNLVLSKLRSSVVTNLDR